jgi:hypothetical protein
MTTTLKYNLKQITDISFSGINFEIPEDTYNMINYLCMQVGSSSIVSNVFNKPRMIDLKFLKKMRMGFHLVLVELKQIKRREEIRVQKLVQMNGRVLGPFRLLN